MALTKMRFSVKRTSTFGVIDFTIIVGEKGVYDLLKRESFLWIAEENHWLHRITSIVVRYLRPTETYGDNLDIIYNTNINNDVGRRIEAAIFDEVYDSALERILGKIVRR